MKFLHLSELALFVRITLIHHLKSGELSVLDLHI